MLKIRIDKCTIVFLIKFFNQISYTYMLYTCVLCICVHLIIILQCKGGCKFVHTCTSVGQITTKGLNSMHLSIYWTVIVSCFGHESVNVQVPYPSLYTVHPVHILVIYDDVSNDCHSLCIIIQGM